MSLTLDAIAKNPNLYRYSLENNEGEKMTLRPLEHTDKDKLVYLIQNLSLKTKQFYSYEDSPNKIAEELCDSINKYDKLRFVLEKGDTKEFMGLFEFSFDIPIGDIERFNKYNIHLSTEKDCRIGPLIKDEYQSKGLASLVFPILIETAKQFSKERFILWGGVQQQNSQAIRFYEKNGFKKVGLFTNKDNFSCYDMMLKM